MRCLSVLVICAALSACGGEAAQEDLASQFDQAADALPNVEEVTEEPTIENDDAAAAEDEDGTAEPGEPQDEASAEFGAMMQDLEDPPE